MSMYGTFLDITAALDTIAEEDENSQVERIFYPYFSFMPFRCKWIRTATFFIQSEEKFFHGGSVLNRMEIDQINVPLLMEKKK